MHYAKFQRIDGEDFFVTAEVTFNKDNYGVSGSSFTTIEVDNIKVFKSDTDKDPITVHTEDQELIEHRIFEWASNHVLDKLH